MAPENYNSLTAVLSGAVAAIPVASALVGWVQRTWSRKFQECHEEREALALRVTVLEAANGGDLPRWVRSSNKRIVSVSPQFVALFGTRLGLTEADFLGRTFAEVAKLNSVFVESLEKMDAVLMSGRTYATAHGVEVTNEMSVTVVKMVLPTKHGTLFVGCAVPEQGH